MSKEENSQSEISEKQEEIQDVSLQDAPSQSAQKTKVSATEKKDIFSAILEEEEEEIKIRKAKKSKNITFGVVHIKTTFNNALVTVTDLEGNTIGSSSAGKMGFKGSRKGTAYAAQVVCRDACQQAQGHGFQGADVEVKGPGAGRESAVRAVQASGILIKAIRDVTPIPHNGCRPKKARRV